MNTEDVVCLYTHTQTHTDTHTHTNYGILCTHRKERNDAIAATWMDLAMILLNESSYYIKYDYSLFNII